MELSDDIMERLEGRSSLARIGIIVHSTAGLFDPGWVGTATLELGNLGRMPVKLYPGDRICAFTFQQLSSPVKVPYKKKSAISMLTRLSRKVAGSATTSSICLIFRQDAAVFFAGQLSFYKYSCYNFRLN